MFRDLFPGEVLSPGQLVNVATMTFLVTAVEDSDALYTGLGDARAFAILREHVLRLEASIRREGGAMVKTVGDGLVATFPDSASAVRVGLGLADTLSAGENTRSLRVRAAVHRGAAMAATINDHLDYFGLAVNQAWALLGLAGAGDLVYSQAVASEPSVMAALKLREREPEVFTAPLPGETAALIHRVADPTRADRRSP